MKLVSAAIMIRLSHALDSDIAQKDTASAFSHSLGQKRKSSMGYGMSALGGRADEIRVKADIAARRSVAGGRSDLPRTWPELRLLANCGHSTGSLFGISFIGDKPLGRMFS